MFKLCGLILGLIASIVAAVLQGVPTFWPKKKGQKPSGWIGIFWAIALCFWFIFGSISIFDYWQLEQSNQNLTLENKGYEKEVGFDKTFISFLSKPCIDDTGKKYSEAQKRLKEVDKIHQMAGSPEALISGLGLNGASE